MHCRRLHGWDPECHNGGLLGYAFEGECRTAVHEPWSTTMQSTPAVGGSRSLSGASPVVMGADMDVVLRWQRALVYCARVRQIKGLQALPDGFGLDDRAEAWLLLIKPMAELPCGRRKRADGTQR